MENVELTDLEKDLIELIGAKRGAANAISRQHLCEVLDYVGDRRIRATIHHLRWEHNVVIASGPRGYYTPIAAGEIRAACKYYHSYAMACLCNESKLSGKPLMEILGQLPMELSADSAEEPGFPPARE